MERIAWFKAYSMQVGAMEGYGLLLPSETRSRVDYGRIAWGTHVAVQLGHLIADPGIQLEEEEESRVYSEYFGPPLEPTRRLELLNVHPLDASTPTERRVFLAGEPGPRFSNDTFASS